MGKLRLYTEAYRILNNTTPLRTDCGRLCNKICCESLEENSGMYLFPGEEIMYSSNPNWLTITPAKWPFADNGQVSLAVCSGHCNRNERPLACRIFPLTPYITHNDILQVKMDPRAELLCPLAKYSSRNQLNKEFVRNVRQVFRQLIEDDDIKNFIVELSAMLDEYSKLPWRSIK